MRKKSQTRGPSSSLLLQIRQGDLTGVSMDRLLMYRDKVTLYMGWLDDFGEAVNAEIHRRDIQNRKCSPLILDAIRYRDLSLLWRYPRVIRAVRREDAARAKQP